MDKEAVSKALENRYGDKIKAEEYLEKIFNFSFYMPEFSVEKFIKQYSFFNDDNIAKKLAKFFEAINFTNPRHLKKVLNKYEYLVEVKKSGIDKKLDKNGEGLIPDIITGNGGYLFYTIFVLYFIILYEFYYDKYLEIKNIDDKLNNYAKYFRNIGWNERKNVNRSNKPKRTNIEQMLKKYINKDILNEPMKNIMENIYKMNTSKKLETNRNLLKLISIFTPLIKTETEYNIYDISLKWIRMKKPNTGENDNKKKKNKNSNIKNNNNKEEDNEDNKTIEVYADDDFINEYKKDGYEIEKGNKKTYDEYYENCNDEDIKKAIKSNLSKYIEQFEYKNNEILINFCKYLISEDFFEIIKADYEKGYNNNDYTFEKLFEMVETLL